MESLKGEITHYYNDEFKQHIEANGINETWEKFKDVLNQLMKKHIPQRNIKQNCKLPLVNNVIRRLMRRRKRARAKSKKRGKVADWNRYKEMDKYLKKQLREAHNEYLTHIFADDDDRLSKNGIHRKPEKGEYRNTSTSRQKWKTLRRSSGQSRDTM